MKQLLTFAGIYKNAVRHYKRRQISKSEMLLTRLVHQDM
jgi:hypothetical protein